MTACVQTSSGTGLKAVSVIPTLITSSHPEYTAAQATLAAGQAEAQNMAIQSTRVALNFTQAVATEAAFVRQTQRVEQSTATAQVAQATAQQAALNTTATANQQTHLHAVAQTASLAQTQADQATQTADAAHTATAWPQTATPLAATQQVIIARAEAAQRRAHWEQILIPSKVIFLDILGCVILVLLTLGGMRAYRRLLPALEMRLGTIPRGPHDAPLILFNDLIIDPDRNFGPALEVSRGNVQTTGLAPTPQLQERLVARDQAVDLARTSMQRHSSPSSEVFSSSGFEPVSSVEIEIVEPKQVKSWLKDVERKLLPSGSANKE
ncbi:MAG: hypothetical protein U9Q82_03895 [Chloroflexota bacterium]|nr:hypothetical protein [Chloroflexota bacterium]